MKNKFIFMLAVLGAILPQTFALADGTFAAIPELPLMPGMTEVALPDLRPGEGAAVYTGNERMALTYYFQHLQEDGWESVDPQHTQYKRGEQTLGIGATMEKGKTTFRAKIWPVSNQPETPATPTPEQILDGTNNNDATPAPEGQQ